MSERADPLSREEHWPWHESGCATCTALDPLLVGLNEINHADSEERDLIVRLAGGAIDAERRAATEREAALEGAAAKVIAIWHKPDPMIGFQTAMRDLEAALARAAVAPEREGDELRVAVTAMLTEARLHEETWHVADEDMEPVRAILRAPSLEGARTGEPGETTDE